MISSSAYPSALKMEAKYTTEKYVDFNGLHGVISHKIILFITTDVRT
jgi:hypothetical protein